MQDESVLAMLNAYADGNPARFHMPGHKGFLPFASDAARLDITEIDGADNLMQPDGVILAAQEKVAAAFGAQKTFFLVNGSTVGILAILLALPRKSKIVVARDAHRSVLSGLALGDHEPVFVYPEYEDGQYGVVSATTIDDALEKTGARAVLLTRPNYFGQCADGESIAAVCSKHNALLLVDEAHGAHFAFSKSLPQSACVFADFVVQSAHKTLNALNQGAFLHVCNGTNRARKADAPSVERLQRMIHLLQTTSPSYPILASLEYAVRSADEQAWTFQTARCDAVRRQLGGGLADGSGRVGWAGVSQIDRTRLVIDTTARGITGHEAYQTLRKCGVVLEMADERRLVAITSPSDEDEWYMRLREGLKRLPFGRRSFAPVPRFEQEPVRALPLCEAVFAQTKLVPLDKSAGQIAAVSLGVYPPGTALVAPGEVIGAQTASFLREQELMGATLFGISLGSVPCVR